jgi:hypothetical protein
MKFFHVLVAFFVMVGVTGAFLVGRHLQRSTPREARTEVIIPSGGESVASDDVARLERALARTEARLVQMEAKQPQPPSGASEPAEAPPKAVVSTPEEIAERFRERAQAFSSERRDDSWAAKEEGAISKATESALANGEQYKVESLSCRNSMCRMEIALAGDSERKFGIGISSQLADSDIKGFHFVPLRHNDDGTEVLEVLAFRRGYPMPGDVEAQ